MIYYVYIIIIIIIIIIIYYSNNKYHWSKNTCDGVQLKRLRLKPKLNISILYRRKNTFT